MNAMGTTRSAPTGWLTLVAEGRGHYVRGDTRADRCNVIDVPAGTAVFTDRICDRIIRHPDAVRTMYEIKPQRSDGRWVSRCSAFRIDPSLVTRQRDGGGTALVGPVEAEWGTGDLLFVEVPVEMIER